MNRLPIIEVKSLSKIYRLGTIGLHSLIEDFRGIASRIGFSSLKPDSSKNFCALDQVSFQAFPGEALGIIGHNGAGKSTLLKILSRITEPSSGNALIRGKVASLLEVGTGFHPEMTGRENIFLNGAFLGLSKREIEDSFDSIVKFAHIEKFIDTPVKRYSSGMYVRLAFAIAAHLQPDVLIVDEVLAVGDLAFQKKCVEKMQDVAESGMTILFVSHNMEMIRRLCKRSILLEKGRIIKIGETSDVVNAYVRSKQELSLVFNADYRSERRRGVGFARFEKIRYCDKDAFERQRFISSEVISFMIEIVALEDLASLKILISIKTESQQNNIITIEEIVSESKITKKQTIKVKVNLIKHSLMPGSYPLYFWLGTVDHLHMDVLDDLLPPLQIVEKGNALEKASSLCSCESSLEVLPIS
jgi:lipopolysaccharide transport system ATP-binding protein